MNLRARRRKRPNLTNRHPVRAAHIHLTHFTTKKLISSRKMSILAANQEKFSWVVIVAQKAIKTYLIKRYLNIQILKRTSV